MPVKVAQPVAWAMSPARLVAFHLLSKPCQVVSTAAEKIGIDHIARVVPQGALHTSALEPFLEAWRHLPSLASLTSLYLSAFCLEASEDDPLGLPYSVLTAVRYPALTQLTLHGVSLKLDDLRRVFASSAFPRLRHLELHDTGLTDDDLLGLASTPLYLQLDTVRARP